MNYTFSNQAVGAIMMALQKSLMEQSDIVPVLTNFQVQIDDSGELVIMNPNNLNNPKNKISKRAFNNAQVCLQM